ncbi:hypothetical protein ABZ358_49070, partial [Streptomyces mirabilis]
GEYLLGGATSSSFPCSGQPYWVPVRKPRGPSGLLAGQTVRRNGLRRRPVRRGVSWVRTAGRRSSRPPRDPSLRDPRSVGREGGRALRPRSRGTA